TSSKRDWSSDVCSSDLLMTTATTTPAPATTKDKVRHKYRHGPGFWASRIALYALLALFLVPVLFPVYYVFAGAVMEPRELSNFPPQLLPTGLHRSEEHT